MRSTLMMLIGALGVAGILRLAGGGPYAKAAEGPPILGPYAVSMNYTTDLMGDPDPRDGTWGRAGVSAVDTPFHPPAGYRVRVMRVYGDFSAWPRGYVPAGKYTGILWGLTTTAPVASQFADFAADECFVYIQEGLDAAPVRAPFDYDTHVNGILGRDNTLRDTMAVFLNDTQAPVHMEATFVSVFQFEPDDGSVAASARPGAPPAGAPGSKVPGWFLPRNPVQPR